ncbi:MAG: CsbD family protein [Caulobacteraceae bacterium]
MNRMQTEGAGDKMKGAVKEAAGKVTDNERLEAEGKGDRVKGSVKDAAGDVQQAIHDATR